METIQTVVKTIHVFDAIWYTYVLTAIKAIGISLSAYMLARAAKKVRERGPVPLTGDREYGEKIGWGSDVFLRFDKMKKEIANAG